MRSLLKQIFCYRVLPLRTGTTFPDRATPDTTRDAAPFRDTFRKSSLAAMLLLVLAMMPRQTIRTLNAAIGA